MTKQLSRNSIRQKTMLFFFILMLFSWQDVSANTSPPKLSSHPVSQADAILDYLQRKGIEKNRIIANGHGGQEPLNKCLLDIDCSIEEHAINDRVEIKIIRR